MRSGLWDYSVHLRMARLVVAGWYEVRLCRYFLDLRYRDNGRPEIDFVSSDRLGW